MTYGFNGETINLAMPLRGVRYASCRLDFPVTQTTASGIEAADFGANRLLATFPEDLRQRVIKGGEAVWLEQGSRVFDRGENITRSIFPLGSTTVSLNAQIEGGRSIEAASIGSEGAIGGIVSCGNAPAFSRADVISPGRALAVPMAYLEEAKAESGHLRNLFCRYSDYLLAQIMQSVACNAFHPIEARAARWLLTAQDRAGPRLQLTQDALAQMLGVQRTTINAVARQLQDEGLVTVRRGVIEILSREGLMARSCSCHDAVERFFGSMIGEGGTGGSVGCS